jgi:hypothetical protein
LYITLTRFRKEQAMRTVFGIDGIVPAAGSLTRVKGQAKEGEQVEFVNVANLVAACGVVVCAAKGWYSAVVMAAGEQPAQERAGYGSDVPILINGQPA